MASAFKFRMQGTAELERALLQLPKAAGKSALRAAARTALIPVAVDAARRAPRSQIDHPHFADSFAVSTRIKRGQKGGQWKRGVTVAVGSKDPKAHLVEFGTSHSGARPTLRPAWEANRDAVLRTFGDEMWTELVKAARRLARRAERYAKRPGRL